MCRANYHPNLEEISKLRTGNIETKEKTMNDIVSRHNRGRSTSYQESVTDPAFDTPLLPWVFSEVCCNIVPFSLKVIESAIGGSVI